ncbi:MAG: F0F1 ATP synthase subunit B [Candidatus Nomurabacteria bacterium]|jgi:F-type H+-transporting ATPase subunit b|nr:F0F1 ATP synthase subunit B [Candidatus Nomurabacteria bacterium]
MLGFLRQFATATETATDGDIFGSLGIDWQMLILQMIAFMILVFILGKFIYPQIAAMLDRREKLIADSVLAAREAEEKAAASEAETAKMLREARAEAGEIVATARKESADIIADAEANAGKKAASIVAGARAEIERDVQGARQALRDEVVELVALATEKVVGDKINHRDAKIIVDTLKRENK